MIDNNSPLHPMFTRLTDQVQLSTWLVKYFFSEKKAHNKWWSADVNVKNVLAYISQQNSNFPLSPKDVCDDWFLKKTLSNTDLTDFDYEIEAPKTTKPKKASVYNTGVTSLKNIGNELHGVTAMMALKIETSATNKLQSLAGTTNYYAGLAGCVGRITAAEDVVANEYGKLLSTVSTSAEFLSLIKKLYHITRLEMMDISTPGEIAMIDHLIKQDSLSVEQYLKGDIIKDNNRMKSFQTMLSRYIYPGKRRGRPIKQFGSNI